MNKKKLGINNLKWNSTLNSNKKGEIIHCYYQNNIGNSALCSENLSLYKGEKQFKFKDIELVEYIELDKKKACKKCLKQYDLIIEQQIKNGGIMNNVETMNKTREKLNLVQEEKKADIDYIKVLSHIEHEKINIEKIGMLCTLLESTHVDTEKTIMGSEPLYKETFDDVDKVLIKNKLVELIKKM